MIGLDTNVLVRYIMQDDPKQAPRANALIEQLTAEEPGFVSLVTVVELVWVLSSGYELERSEVSKAMELLLRAKQLVVEQSERVNLAWQTYKSTSADFADCLIQRLCAGAGCARTMTFDKNASKIAGMVLIP